MTLHNKVKYFFYCVFKTNYCQAKLHIHSFSNKLFQTGGTTKQKNKQHQKSWFCFYLPYWIVILNKMLKPNKGAQGFLKN